MRHEKIFKRDDGSRVKIRVWISTDLYNSRDLQWGFDVHIAQKRKRNWEPACNEFDYAFRSLSHLEKKKRLMEKSLMHVTPEEIHAAMIELWQMIEPQEIKVNECTQN